MNKLTKLSYLCASLLVAGCNSTPQTVVPEPIENDPREAVLVFYNGDVITVDDSKKFEIKHEDKPAVLVVDGIIKKVGHKDKVKNIIQANYVDDTKYNVQYIDLNGRTLMPGFIEPHAHLEITAQAGMVKNLMPCLPNKYQQKLDTDYGWFYYPKDKNGQFSGCYLYLDDAIASVATEGTVVNGWKVGNGLDPSRMVQKKYAELGFDERLNKNKEFLNFPMSYIKDEQGQLMTEHPVFLFDQSGHLAYANMKAFEKSGFCDKTVSPSELALLSPNAKEKLLKLGYSYSSSSDGVLLSCSGKKQDMQRNQIILQDLCFSDGELAITPMIKGDEQADWQYSGLIKESSAYMMFVNAMMSKKSDGALNIRGMIKHGASEGAQAKCPISESSVQQNEPASLALMNTMKYILNTSSQQGVTMFVEGGTTPEMKANYTTLADNDEAYTRIRSLYDWREFDDTTTRVPLDDEVYNGMFSAEGIKLLSDGSTQGCSANLVNDYSEDGLCEAFGRGHEDYNQDEIQKNLQKFADCGWYFNIHANGDQAIKDSVGALIAMKGSLSDAYGSDVACKNRQQQTDYSQLHHTIIHSTVSNKQSGKAKNASAKSDNAIVENYLEARKELPNLSPSHLIAHVAYWGASMRNELGDARGNNIDPMGDEKRAGIPFSMHSDLSISPLFPLWFIEQAVTRNTWEYPNLEFPSQSLNTEQAITIQDAIKAVTLVPAQQHNIADKLGSITEGKLADLIVLDQNPLEFDTDEEGRQKTNIHSINVECTFISGEQIKWFDLKALQDTGEEIVKGPNCALLPGRLSDL